ncbi:hypothetical protein GLAREA_10353 [Glarea lozoyensis ATCC 20868]|uniref:Thioredoxin-like protein AAED1 n=1 Tax=Glarea lozoyensis (strain ATCC 20868 / MF5171) TaxID=1116229 RepID=S3DC35_GLAL2|nr:uncharacterized protein GLAREA_10353 [Glarea lozoyensis ATCC 20868]EPE34659.1 hypothetical protein GLAREA_10353 [Glarea lozoyensis ATCC 20868]
MAISAARDVPTAATNTTPPKTSIDTSTSSSLNQKDADNIDSTAEFAGELDTNDKIPSQAVLKKIEGLVVLDKDGKTVPFKDIYNGPNVARRVLVIFIRHFFCGNCQEFVRTLTSSITPDSLLTLPTPTFIAIIGCGSPSLIPMWYEKTGCPFPCYADPTKKLYDELGMLKTLNLGSRPEYQRQGLVTLMTGAFVQSLKAIKSGRVFQGGGYQQVGGEFLFEPLEGGTPMLSPEEVVGESERSEQELSESVSRDHERTEFSAGLKALRNGDVGRGPYAEEKRITWCHRMRTTRDHAEIPEIREVLGLDGEGTPGRDRKRWEGAVRTRKGTGLSGSGSRERGA